VPRLLLINGLLARRLALAMARMTLDEGRDVVVPQFLARPRSSASCDE
jgi:hypothetical protein